MTEVIARVHSVHFLNIEKRQAAADLQTKPPDYARFSQLYRIQPQSPFTVPRRVEG